MTVHQLWGFPSTSPGDGASHGDAVVSLTAELQQLMDAHELMGLHDLIQRYHTHPSHPHQCSSAVVQHVRARIEHVWQMVRQFDNPQAYKRFIKTCSMNGDGTVGSTREVEVVSGLPAASSMERLEILDEEQHILSFKIVGGQHRLQNYRSVTTLHETMLAGDTVTIVIESYVVDVPHGNTIDETRVFADTIVRYNLQSLARIFEHQA